jgi:hypothetical protein
MRRTSQGTLQTMAMLVLVFVPYRPIWPEPAKSHGKSKNVMLCRDFAVNCEIDEKARIGKAN